LTIYDHFEAEEFDIFIKWIDCLKRENIQLMNLFGQSSSYSRPQSSWPGFPGINDDFSDPNNLRGRLADSSILRTMHEFDNLVQRVQAELLMCYTNNINGQSNDNESATAKIPSAVIVIITDYLPFPQPPSPPHLVETTYQPIIDDVD
jgi:hypothetical protein